MRQKLFFVLFILFLTSCSTTKDAMNLWIGHSSQEVILRWGPPDKIASDGGTGRIFVYTTQGSTYGGQVFYDHKLLYIDNKEKVYYWMVKQDYVPPTQVDVSIYRRF